jgi:Zn-dependent protease with chaperone function
LTGWMSLAVLVAASSVLLAAAAAALVTMATHVGRDWLGRVAMEGRVRLLVLLAVAPMAVSGLIVALCFAPSALATVGLMSDHCLSNLHDHLHLCFQHLPAIGPGRVAWLITAAGAMAFTAAGWTCTGAVVRGHRASRALAALVTRRDDHVDWVDSPASLSLTAGLWSPRVFISRGLRDLLDPHEVEAAIAHERCHAGERHGLVKLVALCGSMIHGPATRRRLLELVSLACERRADEHAASVVGNRLSVASAILRAHRAAPRSTSPLVFALSGDESSALQRRVGALLTPPVMSEHTNERRVLLGIAAITVAGCSEIHHAVEAAMSLLV